MVEESMSESVRVEPAWSVPEILFPVPLLFRVLPQLRVPEQKRLHLQKESQA
jgi:hypothetical protein